MLCAFSTQFSENKGWCSLFTDDDLEVLNYWIDMKNYYGHSYGNKLAYEASCPLMADITNSLKKFVNASMPIGIFRFAHSGTVFALETILEQFYHGVIYDSDMYHKDQYRPFRSYDMAPMGANVAFVLYKCSGSEEYKVQVLVNEKLMELPCCKRNGQTTCSLDIFSLCFGQSCNFDEMCRVSSASLRHVPTLWLVIVIVVLNIHFCFGRMTSECFNNILSVYQALIIDNLDKIIMVVGMMAAASMMLITMMMLLIGLMIAMIIVIIVIIAISSAMIMIYMPTINNSL